MMLSMAKAKLPKLENGWVKAKVRLSRTGIFEYQQPDGSVLKVLRPPEEVFSEKAMASFSPVPVTDGHPVKPVDAKNAKTLSVGTVSDVKQDGKFLAGTILVTDEEMVRKMEDGLLEVSSGYFCNWVKAEPGATYVDPETGATTNYDFIHRNIEGNHLAVVKRGRAGPDVRVVVDSVEDRVLFVDDSSCLIESDVLPTEEIMTVKITFDSVEFEAAPELAKAIETERAALKATFDAAAARADVAESEVKKLTEELAAANSQERINNAVKARVALETEARKYLGPDFALDSLDEAGVKKAVIATLDSSLSVEGKSQEYIDAVYATATRLAFQKNALTEAAAKVVAGETAPTPAKSLDDIQADYRAKFFGKKKGN